MSYRNFRLLVIGGFLLISMPLLRGGERSNIRGMGMARTFVESSRGLDAVGINPANFGVNDSSTFSFTFLPLGGHVGSDFLSYALYTKYFTGVETDSGRVGRYLTEADKKVITNSFSDPMGRTTADVEVTLLGIAYHIKNLGGGAFTVSDHVGAFADIPRDYVEFILNGNPVGSSYQFNGTKLQASWIREYALSFGGSIRVKFLKSLALGAAAKLIHGFGYYEVQRFNTSLSTDQQATLTGSVDFLSRQAGSDPAQARFLSAYQLFPRVAGKGPGFDLGAHGEVNEFLSYGVSVTDIGSIRWTKGTEEKSADTTIVVDDPLNEAQRSMVEDVVKGKSRSAGSFTTSLPTTLRLGFALDVKRMPEMNFFPGQLLLELDYNQALMETPFSTTTPRVSFGAEYKPMSWLPLRTGVSFGGTDRVNVALGFGVQLAMFEFEFASENVTWLFAPQSFSHGSLAGGMRLSF